MQNVYFSRKKASTAKKICYSCHICEETLLPLCPPSQTAIFVYYRLDVYVCLFAVHSLPHLTVLSLSGCSKITDDGVELIAENLQKLRALDLSWCPRITDAALEYIACDLNMLEELTLDRFGL